MAVSRDFYLTALTPLEFEEADGKTARFVRLTNGAGIVIVLAQVEDRFRSRGYHRKSVGMNHFALSVAEKTDIDAMSLHLHKHGIPILGSGIFEIQYRGDYCGLMFEDPDRIMIEIVYHHHQYYDP